MSQHLWIRGHPLCSVALVQLPGDRAIAGRCATCALQAAHEFTRMAVSALGAEWADAVPAAQLEELAARLAAPGEQPS